MDADEILVINDGRLVAEDTLYLQVGDAWLWTGAAGDGKMSTAGNWMFGVPAAGADIDFSDVSSATAITNSAALPINALSQEQRRNVSVVVFQ